MNKVQFNDILNYLQTHPSEAQRLRMVLMGESELQADPQQQNLRQADQWLTAREVGERIGQSSRWLRERIHLLPEYATRQSRRKNTWYINYPLVSDQLQQMRLL